MSSISLSEKHLKRFWKYIDKKDDKDCWNWKGTPSKNGYAHLRVGKKLINIHRLSWIIHFGDIPDGMCVLHKCDNRICGNPNHLFLGSTQDNSDDKLSKQRQARGRKIGVSKLDPKDVIEIRKLLSEGMSERKIATLFGVWGGTVWNIKTNKAWSWVK